MSVAKARCQHVRMAALKCQYLLAMVLSTQYSALSEAEHTKVYDGVSCTDL
jgi:hypothetical protein